MQIRRQINATSRRFCMALHYIAYVCCFFGTVSIAIESDAVWPKQKVGHWQPTDDVTQQGMICSRTAKEKAKCCFFSTDGRMFCTKRASWMILAKSRNDIYILKLFSAIESEPWCRNVGNQFYKPSSKRWNLVWRVFWLYTETATLKESSIAMRRPLNFDIHVQGERCICLRNTGNKPQNIQKKKIMVVKVTTGTV